MRYSFTHPRMLNLCTQLLCCLSGVSVCLCGGCKQGKAALQSLPGA